MANNAEHRNPKLLDGLIRKYKVDVMTVTPSLMKINYDNREPDTALAQVKNMVFGGEPLPEKFVKDLRALSDDITIYNIYGPSEITVLSNVQNLDNEKEITVGPPILNTQMYILETSSNRSYWRNLYCWNSSRGRLYWKERIDRTTLPKQSFRFWKNI